jgi:hypothetical protein
MSRFTWLRLFVVLVVVGGLSSPVSAGTIRDDRSDSLYLDLGALPQYASVGQFIGNGGGFAASGVLIAPNWALTAAHVVVAASSLDFDLDGPGGTFSAYTATSWIAHPNWNGDLFNGYDIGLVEFSDDIAALTGITPAKRYRGRRELGQIGTSVGFGWTGTGLTGATIFDGQKRAGNNVIDTLWPTTGRPRILLSDFDNPLNPDDNWSGSATPLELEYMVSFGDSGGGLFVTNGRGNDVLAGLHSFMAWIDEAGDSDYGDISGHTRVSAFNDWIDSIIGGNRRGPPEGKGPPWTRGGTLPSNGAAVPEPSTLWLLSIAGLCLAGRRWRKRRR